MSDQNHCFICQYVEAELCPICKDKAFCRFHAKNHILKNREGKFICAPVLLRQVEGVGRCLVASRDIGPGELVLLDEAAAWGPKEVSEELCPQCLKLTDEKCERCNCNLCSDASCIENHLKCDCLFLRNCKNDKSLLLLSSVTPLRLHLASQRDSNLLNSLNLLMDHEDDRQIHDPDHMSRSQDVVSNFGQSESFNKSVARCIGLLHVNALNIDNRAGRALFPTFSFLSHSCCNNAKHVVKRVKNKYEIWLYSQKEITKGQEITITYINLLRAPRERRANLMSQWFFDCQCDRCLNPLPIDHDLATVICPKCKSEPLIFDYENDVYRCQACHSKVDEEAVARLTWVLKENLSEAPKSVAELRELKSYFQRFLGQHHYLMIVIKRMLSQLLSESRPEEVLEKWEHASEIVGLFDVLDPGYSSSRGLALIELAKATVISETQERKVFLGSKLEEVNKCLCMELSTSLEGKALSAFKYYCHDIIDKE